MMRNTKAQGSLEYLLLIGGAVVVGSVVIVLMLNTAQSSGSTTAQATAALEVKKELAFAGINQSALQAAWKLNGNTGDASGNGLTGTVSNGASFVTDPQRGAVAYFDGSTQQSDSGGIMLPSVNPTGAITVSAWVKTISYNTDWQLVSKYTAYILGTWDGPVCFIVSTVSGGWQYATNNTNSNCYSVSDPQNWHQYVGTFDNATNHLYLYVDGVRQASYATSGGTINADTGPIEVGGNEGWGNYPIFQGYIGDVMVFNTALTDQQVASLYAYQEK